MRSVSLWFLQILVYLLSLKTCENHWLGMSTANLLEQMGGITLSAPMMYHETTYTITTSYASTNTYIFARSYRQRRWLLYCERSRRQSSNFFLIKSLQLPFV